VQIIVSALSIRTRLRSTGTPPKAPLRSATSAYPVTFPSSIAIEFGAIEKEPMSHSAIRNVLAFVPNSHMARWHCSTMPVSSSNWNVPPKARAPAGWTGTSTREMSLAPGIWSVRSPGRYHSSIGAMTGSAPQSASHPLMANWAPPVN
jgi:hypothetical protein